MRVRRIVCRGHTNKNRAAPISPARMSLVAVAVLARVVLVPPIGASRVERTASQPVAAVIVVIGIAGHKHKPSMKTVVAETMMECMVAEMMVTKCRECMVLKVMMMAPEVMTPTHPAEVTAVPRLRGLERA